MKKEKQIIKALEFEKYYDGFMRGFPFKDLPKDIQEDDWIEFEAWEEEFTSDGGRQSGSELKVFRKRLETDEEFKSRIEFWEKKFAQSKEERRKLYFKLRQEFKNEPPQKDPNAKTSIPEDRWGVHKNHCCVFHGCKYGYQDCPVVLQLIVQDYPCEICHDLNEEQSFVPSKD